MGSGGAEAGAAGSAGVVRRSRPAIHHIHAGVTIWCRRIARTKKATASAVASTMHGSPASGPKSPPVRAVGPGSAGDGEDGRVHARHRSSPHRALEQVPGPVEPDGDPERACGDVGRGEERPGSDGDREAADPGGPRVVQVPQAEEGATEDHRQPGPEALLQESEEDPARGELLEHPHAEEHEEESREEKRPRRSLRHGRPADDPVAPHQGQHAHHRGEQRRAEQEAAQGVRNRPGRREARIARSPPFEEPETQDEDQERHQRVSKRSPHRDVRQPGRHRGDEDEQPEEDDSENAGPDQPGQGREEDAAEQGRHVSGRGPNAGRGAAPAPRSAAGCARCGGSGRAPRAA